MPSEKSLNSELTEIGRKCFYNKSFDFSGEEQSSEKRVENTVQGKTDDGSFSSSKKETITFDDVMIIIGEFGPYQFLIFLTFALGMIIEVMLVMSFVFVADVPEPFHCSEPRLNHLNLSEELKHNISSVNGGSCLMYDRDYSNWTMNTVEEWRKGLHNDSPPQINCKFGWFYSRNLYEETIVSKVSKHYFVYILYNLVVLWQL